MRLSVDICEMSMRHFQMLSPGIIEWKTFPFVYLFSLLELCADIVVLKMGCTCKLIRKVVLLHLSMAEVFNHIKSLISHCFVHNGRDFANVMNRIKEMCTCGFTRFNAACLTTLQKIYALKLAKKKDGKLKLASKPCNTKLVLLTFSRLHQLI